MVRTAVNRIGARVVYVPYHPDYLVSQAQLGAKFGVTMPDFLLVVGVVAASHALAGRKDDMVTIAELGIDQLIVDEAHEFRKLSFATNMSGLKGVDPDGSQRAWDLLVKARFIAKRQPARPLILASGTPITSASITSAER